MLSVEWLCNELLFPGKTNLPLILYHQDPNYRTECGDILTNKFGEVLCPNYCVLNILDGGAKMSINYGVPLLLRQSNGMEMTVTLGQ